MWVTIARLAIELMVELLKAYRQAKADDEVEKIRKNPSAWFADHFGNRVSGSGSSGDSSKT